MKVNLVTSIREDDQLECLRLWSLIKTFKKRDCYVKVINVLDTEKVDQDSEDLRAMFPNYMEITTKEQLASELQNGGVSIVTGEGVWKAKDVSKAGKALLLKGIDGKKYAYNVGLEGTKYSFFESFVVRAYLKQFEGITVSNNNDKKYLSALAKDEVAELCDNTLLLRAKEYDELIELGGDSKEPKEEFILLDAEVNVEDLANVAKQAAIETNLKVYCLDSKMASQYGFHFVRVDTPAKFLAIMKAAKYIVADTEKAVIFSMIFRKPFLYMPEKADKVSYVEKLVKAVKLQGNLIRGAEDYDSIDQFKLNLGYALHKRLSEQKKGAYKYLDDITGVKRTEDEYVDAPTDILKKDCPACYACQEVCPVDAITMTEDKKGFYYPVVNKDKCISCMKCKRSCVIQQPRLVEHKETFPKAIAAYNKDLDVRKGSSSGGMFPGFAKHIIEDKQGYVAGAKYDEDMNVVSDVGSTIEEVKAFYGSKYCKSLLDGSFRRIKELLDQGEYVLFSALPCECSGLRAFLGKDYERLYICEIICHAAPSAKVFKEYVKYLEKKFGSKVTHVTFRQKKRGWQAHQTSMVVDFKDREPLRVVNRTNNYYRVFANDYIAREACTNCRFTHMNRSGDITIGDFWGVQDIHPEMYDNQGASFVLINNERGMELWDMVKDDYNWMESSVAHIFKKNHSEPISYKIDSDEFFHRFEKGEPINGLLEAFNDLKK